MGGKRALITGITGQDGSYLAGRAGGPRTSAVAAAAGAGAVGPARGVAGELRQHTHADREGAAGGMLSSGGPELRELLVRRRVLDAERQHQRDAFSAGGVAQPGAAVPLLLRGVERDVRPRARGAADRGHAVPSALVLRHQQSGGVPSDAELPRGVRAARLQRDSVQPRISAARLRVCDAQDRGRRGPGAGGPGARGAAGEPGRAGGTGETRGSTSRRCG